MARWLSDIRPGEIRVTTGAFLTLFGLLAGHTLLETARDALFLAKLPASRLPWMYLVIAAVSMGIFGLEQRRGVATGRTGLAVWLTVSAGVTAVFWFLAGRGDAWVLYSLYAWAGVFATLLVVRFWTLLGDVFTVGQAKRLFATIGAGSVSGAIAGSLAARVIADLADARALLLASVVMLLATAVLALTLLPRIARGDANSGDLRATRSGPAAPHRAAAVAATPRGSRDPMARSLGLAWRRPFLRRVGLLVLVSTITLTFVDYVFKSWVAAAVPAEDLGRFFSGTYLVLNVLSLGAQVFLVRRLVRSAGVNRVLSVLPALLLSGAIALVATGGLVAAFVLKVFDGALRHSLHRTATEVLFVPLPGELRSRVKGVIDVVGQRGGQAAASMLILLAVALGAERWMLGLAIAVLAGVWIYLAKSLQPFYLGLFRDTLSGAGVRTRMEFPELDLASLESMMAALNSPNDREVLAALELLAEQERTRLIPALILYHPSPGVVMRTLELFTAAGRDDFVPLLDRLFERPEPEVRAAALRASAWFAPSAEVFERFARDPAPEVRVVALVGAVSFQNSREALDSIRGLAEVGNDRAKQALAQAIRYSPGAVFEDVLVALAGSSDVAVRVETARTMREILSAKFIPPLLEMIGNREVRAEARRTLVAIGPDALLALQRVMENRWFDPQVRRHVPRTLALFESQEALDVLQGCLLDEPDGVVRYKSLRAIGRMVSEHSALQLDRSLLEAVAERTLRNAYRVLEWRVHLEAGARVDPARATAVHELIRSLLEHKHALALERLFRILGLLYKEEDLRTIFRGLRSSRRDMRASSRELLEHVLSPPIRDAVLNLVDDLPEAETIRRGQPYHRYRALTYADVLRELLEAGGTGARSLVSYHVGELGLNGLRPVLEALPSDRDGFVAQSVERALEVLDGLRPVPEGMTP